jgi:3-hydroxymyristoyl/3-hydroxydecanoyl-(acyl carrier protein) dehydratase
MAVIGFENETGFAAESRFLDGHFPGNPVVPGAVIVAYLSRCLAGADLRITRIERMKFLRPLLPSQPFKVEVERNEAAGKVRFTDGQGDFAIARVALSAN